MTLHLNSLNGLEHDTLVFYRQTLQALRQAEVAFLVGGA